MGEPSAFHGSAALKTWSNAYLGSTCRAEAAGLQCALPRELAAGGRAAPHPACAPPAAPRSRHPARSLAGPVVRGTRRRQHCRQQQGPSCHTAKQRRRQTEPLRVLCSREPFPPEKAATGRSVLVVPRLSAGAAQALWKHCPGAAAAAGRATSAEYKSGLSCEALKATFRTKGRLSAAVAEFLGRLLPLTRTTVIYNVPQSSAHFFTWK